MDSFRPVADVLLPEIARTEAFFAEFQVCSLPKAVEKIIAKQIEVLRSFSCFFFFFFFVLFFMLIFFELEKQSVGSSRLFECAFVVLDFGSEKL